MMKAWIAAVAVVALGSGAYLYLNKNGGPPKGDEETLALDQDPIINEIGPTETPIIEQNPELPTPTDKVNDSAVPSNAPKSRVGKGHFEISALRQDANEVSTRSWRGKTREQRLRDIFQEKGSELQKFVKVLSIKCKELVCTVDAESIDGDIEHFETPVFAIVDDHPWVGNKIDVTTRDNKKLGARFVFFHENAK